MSAGSRAGLAGALAVVALAAAVSGGCRRGGEPAESARTEWIQHIGERQVEPEEFSRYLVREVGMPADELAEDVRARLYEDFFAELLFARAAERLGLDAPAQELEQELELMKSVAPGIPEQELRREAERAVLAREYEQQVLYPEVKISDQEITATLGRERRNTRRNVIVFRQILVDTREAANEAYRRIRRSREPFDEVARQISQSGAGDELQQRRLDTLPVEAARVLERLPEGGVSRPVEIGGMWYLFEVTARNYDPDPGREREREVVRHRLFEEKFERLRAARLAELARLEKVRVPRVAGSMASEENGS